MATQVFTVFVFLPRAHITESGEFLRALNSWSITREMSHTFSWNFLSVCALNKWKLITCRRMRLWRRHWAKGRGDVFYANIFSVPFLGLTLAHFCQLSSCTLRSMSLLLFRNSFFCWFFASSSLVKYENNSWSPVFQGKEMGGKYRRIRWQSGNSTLIF